MKESDQHRQNNEAFLSESTRSQFTVLDNLLGVDGKSARLTQRILQNPLIHTVIFFGEAASGKTTIVDQLAQDLRLHGITPHLIKYDEVLAQAEASLGPRMGDDIHKPWGIKKYHQFSDYFYHAISTASSQLEAEEGHHIMLVESVSVGINPKRDRAVSTLTHLAKDIHTRKERELPVTTLIVGIPPSYQVQLAAIRQRWAILRPGLSDEEILEQVKVHKIVLHTDLVSVAEIAAKIKQRIYNTAPPLHTARIHKEMVTDAIARTDISSLGTLSFLSRRGNIDQIFLQLKTSALMDRLYREFSLSPEEALIVINLYQEGNIHWYL